MFTRIALIPSYEPDEQLINLIPNVYSNGFKIVVVDDGSGEDYKNIFDSLPEYVTVLSYPENHGKGYALKYGFQYIKDNFEGEYTIVTLDSDGQHKVEDAIKLCDECEQNIDELVIGSRLQSKKSPLKSRVGNAISRGAFLLSTGVKVYDTQTGLRAFNSKYIDEMIDIKGDRYEYEMNMLLTFAKKRFTIKEINIETIYLNNNSGSHYHPVRDSLRVVGEVLKYSASSFVGFLIDYLLLLLFNSFKVDWVYWLACSNVLARVVSASVNFTLNYTLVFKSKDKLWRAVLKYFLLAIFVLAVDTFALWVFTKWLLIPVGLAKIIVEIVMAIFNFIIQRIFVFKK